MINRGGEKVHPRQIEEVLLCDPHIRGAAVVGRPHRLLGEECVAYVVTDPGDVTPDLPAKLLDRCRQALSRHQQPASVIVAGALPTGPTGKPDRRALRAAATATARDLAPAVRSATGKQDRHLASHHPQLSDLHYERGTDDPAKVTFERKRSTPIRRPASPSRSCSNISSRMISMNGSAASQKTRGNSFGSISISEMKISCGMSRGLRGV